MTPTAAAFQFLEAVLGHQGSVALAKGLEARPDLVPVLIPRTILSWLAQQQALTKNYEGQVPGVEDSLLRLELLPQSFLYRGVVKLGKSYRFDGADILTVAGTLGLALGLSPEDLQAAPMPQSARLQKLGKSLDLLVGTNLRKAISAIEPGQSFTGDIESMRRSARSKAFMGPPQGAQYYDYSHVLPPEHRQAGMGITISHHPSGTMVANLHHNGKIVGEVSGDYQPQMNSVGIGDAYLSVPYQGKGLGQNLYEAVLAHGHHRGATHVVGDVHSSMASKVHQALSAKHGMDYKPTPTPYPQLKSPEPGPYDSAHGPYKYTIKEELDPTETEEISKGGTQGAEGAGPAAAAIKPKGVDKPQGPQFQQQRGPKPQFSITKSESARPCRTCGRPHFQDEHFQGCLCFSGMDLACVQLQKTESGGYKFTRFGDDWDKEAIAALYRHFKLGN